MVLANIVEFDGETIGGSFQFVFGEQQRRRIALLAPPAEYGLDGAQFGGRDLRQHGRECCNRKTFRCGRR